MKNVIDKARAAAKEAGLPEDSFMACERGASFGYNNLVSDMRSLAIMRETGAPVVFDATHSVQLPGGQGTSSGGQREMVPVLARAAVAVGVAGLFMETHPDPAKALVDGPQALLLRELPIFLEDVAIAREAIAPMCIGLSSVVYVISVMGQLELAEEVLGHALAIASSRANATRITTRNQFT